VDRVIRRRSACSDCLACAAKDQTIAVLADQVDWLRVHMGQGGATASFAAAPPSLEVLEGGKPEPTEEEAEIDSIISELNYGALDPERAEQLTARLQTLTRA